MQQYSPIPLKRLWCVKSAKFPFSAMLICKNDKSRMRGEGRRGVEQQSRREETSGFIRAPIEEQKTSRQMVWLCYCTWMSHLGTLHLIRRGTQQRLQNNEREECIKLHIVTCPIKKWYYSSEYWERKQVVWDVSQESAILFCSLHVTLTNPTVLVNYNIDAKILFGSWYYWLLVCICVCMTHYNKGYLQHQHHHIPRSYIIGMVNTISSAGGSLLHSEPEASWGPCLIKGDVFIRQNVK